MTRFSAATFLILTLTLSCFIAIKVPAVSGTQGPREDDLQLFFYSDVLAAYAALEAGEIDIVGSEIPEAVYQMAIANPDVVLAPVDSMDMHQFDLNNNYSILSYPNIRSPTNYREFRQALAFLTDRDLVVDTFCGGLAHRIDQPVAAPTSAWMNTSYTGVNYPYEYDSAAASALLDANGWTQGSTINLYYDTGFPGSTEYIRTYPPGHEMEGVDVDPVITYVRTDDPRRLQSGRHLYENMRKIGIPVDAREGPSSYTNPPVMGSHDYHIYTGSMIVDRFPTYDYEYYHTDFNVQDGSNYVHGFEADGTPNHPLLDTLLVSLYYADTFADAIGATRNALGVFTIECVTIPLFSTRSYWAYSNQVIGVVNMDSYGLNNGYNFMKAWKADRSPLRYGVVEFPNSLNILHGDASADACLDRINLYASYDMPPYNIAADQPGFITDWTVTSWSDAGTLKTQVTKELRSDNYFCDTGGNQLANVDADHFLFSNYINYAAGSDSQHWNTVKDLKRFNKLNDYEVTIYYDDLSYWLTYAASPPLLPMSVWLNTSLDLTEYHVTDLVVDTDLTTPGFLGLDRPVWINSITGSSSGLLAEWTDYHWELGDWYIDTALISGETVTIEWYQLGETFGFTPGNNNWEDVLVGCGMYYVTDFVPGGGGYFIAKKNPFYWMETPNYGEIDFKWEAGGYYKVTVFDTYTFAVAVGSSGIGVPDSNWFPGADVAPPGGKVDFLFDLMTVSWNYGMTTSATLAYPRTPAPTNDGFPPLVEPEPRIGPLVRVEPSSLEFGLEPEYVIGTEFTVAVVVENVTSLLGLDLRLAWDSDFLEYVNHTCTCPVENFTDPIPPSPYSGLLHAPTLNLKDEVQAGLYWFAETTTQPTPNFNGSGTAFIITFEITKQLNTTVETPLSFNSTDLSTIDGEPISHQAVGGLVHIPPAPMPTVRVEPTLTDYGSVPRWVVDHEFTVAVVVENATNLYGLDIWLQWDSDFLEYVNHTCTCPVEDFPSPVPPSPYPGILHAPHINVADNVYSNSYNYAKVSTAPAPSFNGHGTAFTITFRVKQQGFNPVETTIGFSSTVLAAENATLIEHTTVEGQVRIPPYPNPTVYVDPPIVLVPANTTAFAINLSMDCAQGDVNGYYFELYYNSTVLSFINGSFDSFLSEIAGTMQGFEGNDNYGPSLGRVWGYCLHSSPSPGAFGNGTFINLYFSVAENASTATETPLDLHTDVAQGGGVAMPVFHVTLDGVVVITYAGDVNGDGDVDIYDIVKIASRYDQKIGDPGYDPLLDLNHDGIIDIFDIVKAAVDYGEVIVIPPAP